MDIFMKQVHAVAQTTAQQAWFADMDENQSLYSLDNYQMKNFQGKPIERVSNVTLPAIATFADRVINISGGVLPDIKIKAKEMEEKQKLHTKNFLYGAFDEANDSRARRGLPQFNVKLAEYGALKKLVAARIIVKREGQRTWFDLTPLDPRNLIYRMGIDGPIFVAYRSVRDKWDIFDEYGIEIKGDEATIWDYWDKDRNHVYLSDDTTNTSYEGNLIRTNTNVLGYLPFVIIPLDRTIYHNCKSIYSQMCRTASILKTQSMNTVFGPYEFHTPRNEEVPDMPLTGDIVPMGTDPNEGFKLVPLNDVYQATAFMWQIETSEFQRASYAFIEYGGLEFPLSSLAISQLKEGRDQILFPLLQGITLCYKGLCTQILRQFKEGKHSAKLGEDEYIAQYVGGDLPFVGEDCNVKFSFKATNVSEEGAAYQMAMAAEPFLDLKTRLEQIIKVDNAEETMNKLYIERAENMFPELMLPKIAEAYRQQGRDAEASIIEDMLENPGPEEPQGPPQPVQNSGPQPPPPSTDMPQQVPAAPPEGAP